MFIREQSQLLLHFSLSPLFPSPHRINPITLFIFTSYSPWLKVVLNSKWCHKLYTTLNVTYPLQAVPRHYTDTALPPLSLAIPAMPHFVQRCTSFTGLCLVHSFFSLMNGGRSIRHRERSRGNL